MRRVSGIVLRLAVLAAVAGLVGCGGGTGIRASGAIGAAGSAPPSSSGAAGSGSGSSPSAAPAASPTSPATTAPSATPAPPAQWISAGSIDPGRALTHAVLLAGGDVLVVGEDWLGCGGEGLSALATSVNSEVFLAATGTWQKTASLNAIRVGLVLTPLADGRALVAGGETADGIPFSSVKLFDPTAWTWSQPGLMGYARTDAAGATLQDGRVLVTGGWFPSPTATSRLVPTSEIFNPSTDTWSRTGSLHTLRTRARAVTLSDGRVLIVGGENLAGTPIRTAEIWNPSTGAWSSAGTLPAGRPTTSPDFALVALDGGGALVVGGTSSAAAGAERFDPAALTWSATGPMVTGASERAVAVLADGRVVAAGGLIGSRPTPDVELFDPATGRWAATTPLPAARAGAVAVTLSDGSVLLLGGYSGVDYPAHGVMGGGSGCPITVVDALRYLPADS